MKKRGILLIAALLLLAFLLSYFVEDPEDRAERLLRRNRDAFERTAEAALAGEGWKEPVGVRYLNVWPCQGREGVEQVEFDLGGWGIGSQTDYWGLYTTTDGQPAGFQGTEMDLTAGEDAFTWTEESGDNTYYTREIAPGWWYYRMHF